MMENKIMILSKNHELSRKELKQLNKIEDFLIEFKAKCVYCKRPIEKGSIYVGKKIESNMDVFYKIEGLPKRQIKFECLPERSDCSLAGTLHSVFSHTFNSCYDYNLPDPEGV